MKTLALLILAALSACSPTNHLVIMHFVNAQFARQNYQCVPLGWVPVPFDGTYYEGYSAELDETDWWLPPKWVGSVNSSELKHADVRVTYELLNELVSVGMLDRDRVHGGFRYHLTMRALPFYFDENDFGNNPEHFAYLCYSGIVPQRVIWNQPIHVEQVHGGSGKTQVFRAAFEWLPSTVAPWADSAFIQSHSVILAPTKGPIVVKFVNRQGTWEISNVHLFASALPRIGFADASAWPKSRP